MKQINFFLILISVFSFIFQSCQPAPATEKKAELNMDSIKAKVIAIEAELVAASNARDVERAAKFYSADAQSLANAEPTRVGIDAIKEGIKKDMEGEEPGNTMVFVTTGVWAAGNYVTETGEITTKDKDGKVVYTGKYMTLFELRDGKYICIRDIWNSSSPD
ncbi:MAG TPA: nuclear transport factor 2 family protein [Saprospiraceae bacterium]|nr:nuclear transport factor 2 family protein [Saprospiraceae bacterium]